MKTAAATTSQTIALIKQDNGNWQTADRRFTVMRMDRSYIVRDASPNQHAPFGWHWPEQTPANTLRAAKQKISAAIKGAMPA